MLRPEMKLFEHSEFSSQALTSDFRPFIFLRFRSGTRIPHHVSPSRSIQEILNIFRYFLIQVHFDKSEIIFSPLLCYYMLKAFTFPAIQFTAASAVSDFHILICLSKKSQCFISISQRSEVSQTASCSITTKKEDSEWSTNQTVFTNHVFL